MFKITKLKFFEAFKKFKKIKIDKHFRFFIKKKI